jgi:predicted nucleic-acid-binding Zn-ribbon protein
MKEDIEKEIEILLGCYMKIEDEKLVDFDWKGAKSELANYIIPKAINSKLKEIEEKLPKEKECLKCGSTEFTHEYEGDARCKKCGNYGFNWDDIGFNDCLKEVYKVIQGV